MLLGFLGQVIKLNSTYVMSRCVQLGLEGMSLLAPGQRVCYPWQGGEGREFQLPLMDKGNTVITRKSRRLRDDYVKLQLSSFPTLTSCQYAHCISLPSKPSWTHHDITMVLFFLMTLPKKTNNILLRGFKSGKR